jgi:hypothetical protein
MKRLRGLQIFERVLAIAGTGLIVYLHLVVLKHAGPLWRDEVSSVNLAILSPLSEMWSSLRFDSFPALSFLLLRAWTQAGTYFETDFGLRILGLLVGLGALAAVWLAAALVRSLPPFAALALFGLNPWVLRVGDSLRPYGLGMALAPLTFAFVWRAVDHPSPRRFLAAAASSLLFVHSLYPNALLLAAILLGALVVALRRARWGAAALLSALGFLAAGSLLPYQEALRSAQAWSVLAKIPIDTKWIGTVLWKTLDPSGGLLAWSWVALLLVALLAALLRQRSRQEAGSARRDLALYCGVTTVAAIVVFLLFVRFLSFPTQPWYYLSLLALLAVCIDALLTPTSSATYYRGVRAVVFVVLVGAAVAPLADNTRLRRTNVDLVAHRLSQEARADDLILVNPWHLGITLSRYYRGAAPVRTIPPVADLRFHRLDLFKEQLETPHPIDGLLGEIGSVLRSGNAVWVVGELPLPPSPPPIRRQPWILGEKGGWVANVASRFWALQVGSELRWRASAIERVSVPVPERLDPVEQAALLRAHGWRENP